MNVISKIAFIIFAFIFAEIFVFIEVSLRIGFLNALLVLLFFSAVGFVITRAIKGASFRDAMGDFASGKSPSRNLVKSASHFIAGVLFLIPGFISNFIAVLFIIPLLNLFLVYLILKYFKNKVKGNFAFYGNVGGWNYGGRNNWDGGFNEETSVKPVIISLPPEKNEK